MSVTGGGETFKFKHQTSEKHPIPTFQYRKPQNTLNARTGFFTFWFGRALPFVTASDAFPFCRDSKTSVHLAHGADGLLI